MTRLVSLDVELVGGKSYLVEVPGSESDADVRAAARKEGWEEGIEAGEIIVQLGHPPKAHGTPDFVLRDGRLVAWDDVPRPPSQWYEGDGHRWATDGRLLIREDALLVPEKARPGWIDRDVEVEGLLAGMAAVERREATEWTELVDGRERLHAGSWTALLDGRFLAPFGDRPTLWISADSQSPVQVRRGDDVVGYVMPLREP